MKEIKQKRQENFPQRGKEGLFKWERNERGVVRVLLNRPTIHNAFNDELIASLTSFFHEISRDEGVRLLVLSGEGKSFCAGADLNWMKSMRDYTDEENYRDSLALFNLFKALNDLPFPTMAFVHGFCLGGGMGLVGACDYVMASSTATFGLTEVSLGLIPAVISPFVLGKMGESFGRATFLSGERFSAQEAKGMQLVHHIVEEEGEDAFKKALERKIERFLSGGPKAARKAKELIFSVMKTSSLQDSRERKEEKLRDFTCQMISELRVSEEGQEGMSALLEKRRPSWNENEN